MVGSVLMAVGLALDLAGVVVIYWGARISEARLKEIRQNFDMATGVGLAESDDLEPLLEDREEQARKAKWGTGLLSIGFAFQLGGSLFMT